MASAGNRSRNLRDLDFAYELLLQLPDDPSLMQQRDDLRHLNWKLYGRHDKLYVKQYDAETNLEMHIVLDVSRSMTGRWTIPRSRRPWRFGSCGSGARRWR